MEKITARSDVVKHATRHGQGMTEYVIIVALIVIAAIGLYSFFGQAVRQPAGGSPQAAADKKSGAEAQSAPKPASQDPKEGAAR